MTWAWSISLPPTSKLVLMALADIADDRGICWPSHPTLAAKCTLTDRTVRRVLGVLQAQDLVFIESRFNSSGSRASNRYRLAVDTPPDNLSGGPDTRGMGGGLRCPGDPDTGVLVTTIEPSIEPSLPPPARHRTMDPRGMGGGGELGFPKQLAPPQRRALHDRLTVLNHGQAQQILDELSGRMAVAQVKNPLRYCATLIERMQRGEFVPELGLNVADRRRSEGARRAVLEQIDKASAIEARSPPRDLPVKLREAILRMRTKSSALSKEGN